MEYDGKTGDARTRKPLGTQKRGAKAKRKLNELRKMSALSCLKGATRGEHCQD